MQHRGRYGIDWSWHENQLQKFFKSYVVDTARIHHMRIYIDPLDECGQDIAVDLVEFFRRFTAPISICFSFRHYRSVALEAGNELCVEDQNELDIRVYIQDKSEAHIQRSNIAEAILSEIVSRSRGSLQWVVLVMPQILKAHKGRKSLAPIQRIVRNTPAELNELFTQLLDDIEEHVRSCQSSSRGEQNMQIFRSDTGCRPLRIFNALEQLSRREENALVS